MPQIPCFFHENGFSFYPVAFLFLSFLTLGALSFLYYWSSEKHNPEEPLNCLCEFLFIWVAFAIHITQKCK